MRYAKNDATPQKGLVFTYSKPSPILMVFLLTPENSSFNSSW